jgi:hypothetical protein
MAITESFQKGRERRAGSSDPSKANQQTLLHGALHGISRRF